MAAEEDNFDIDIYGDGDGDGDGDGGEDFGNEDVNQTEPDQRRNSSVADQTSSTARDPKEGAGVVTEGGHMESHHTSDANETLSQTVTSQTHSLKRKEGPDDRPTDPGATAALFVSDLAWWITDDEIRGWANQSGCEDEFEEMTFSEHKVNGKSKGQVYILTSSPQAATAIKRTIDSFADSQKYKQRFSVSYTNPHSNPFKTLPKDANTRNNNNNSNQGNRNASGGFNASGSPGVSAGNFNQQGFRGGRGSFNNRGGGQNMGGYGRGGLPMANGFQGGGMPGFQNNPVSGYGGFQGRGAGGSGGPGMMNNMRGGGMGMRGGRGGMGTNMMGMPMGGMQMGAMNPMGGMGMGMAAMNTPMGMQGGGYQNQGFYPPQGDSNWNPHGAKRTRQE